MCGVEAQGGPGGSRKPLLSVKGQRRLRSRGESKRVASLNGGGGSGGERPTVSEPQRQVTEGIEEPPENAATGVPGGLHKGGFGGGLKAGGGLWWVRRHAGGEELGSVKTEVSGNAVK